MSAAGLIGRDGELSAVASALSRGAQVVTLVGGPGTGKSAIAEAFTRLEPPRERGKAADRKPAIVRCHLGAARTFEELAGALAAALGASLGGAEERAAVLAGLERAIAQRGRVLLILDDADAVVEPLAEALPRWAVGAPEARFLVTSRARLDVDGEVRVDVPPLAVPAAGEEDPRVIEQNEAVRLFVLRAGAAQPGYRIPPREAKTVRDIVRRLDGIPLAIELCAARVPVLGERALAELLAERFDVLDLSRGGADRGARRTLSNAIAWSWDLLDDAGRRALARCGVFRGSFDLAAAAAVGVGGDVGSRQALVGAAEQLEKLEARSLVRAYEPDSFPGERRFTMLASVRAFALDRLAELGDERDVSRLHAEHFARLAEPRPDERVARLTLERADLASAFETALAAGDVAIAARVALRYEPVALAHGPLGPFLAMLDALLRHEGISSDAAARLRLSRGLATLFRGRRDIAVADFEAARALATADELVDVRVLATSKLGLVRGLKGDFAQAGALFAEATREPTASARARGIVLKDQANVLSEAGENDEAMIVLARARDVLSEAGEIREEGFVTMLIGGRLLDEGRLADARRDLDDAIALLRRAGDRRTEAWATVLIALVMSESGDHEGARARLEGAARAFHAIGDTHTEGLVLGYVGNVALEQGLFADAERAYRSARSLLEAAGDKGGLAFVLAASAVASARLGHSAAAKADLERAQSLAADDGRAARVTAIRVLASAARAIEGDPESSVHAADAKELAAPRPGDAEEIRFARRVARASAGRAQAPIATDARLVAAKDGSWLRLSSGDVIRLDRTRTLRGVVERLVAERLRAPGRAVPQGVLVRAGWPDERILPAAAKNRLHVTITRLRRMGLGDLIVHDGDGYLLDPHVDLRIEDPSSDV